MVREIIKEVTEDGYAGRVIRQRNFLGYNLFGREAYELEIQTGNGSKRVGIGATNSQADLVNVQLLQFTPAGLEVCAVQVLHPPKEGPLSPALLPVQVRIPREEFP